jgi:hypothetical protein
MRAKLLLTAAVVLAWSTSLEAQIHPEPGLVIDGKVVVRVYVTLRDQDTPYYPVGRLELRFFRSARDSVSVTTDDAGSVTTLLPAGDYHLVSARDVTWKGHRYSWRIPITVKPGMAAIELREPSDAATPNAQRVVSQDPPPVITEATRSPVTTPPPAAASPPTRRPASSSRIVERDGIWASVGIGMASLDCHNCDGRESGLSGSLSFGTTISQRVLIGIFGSGLTKSQDQVRRTAGTVTVGARAYPWVSTGVHFTAGIGLAGLVYNVNGFGGQNYVGAGAQVGMGYDYKIGNSMSATIFWNGIGMYIDNAAANFGQFGLGITWN